MGIQEYYLKFVLASRVLGVVLGYLFEDNLRRTLSKTDGSWTVVLDFANRLILYNLVVLLLISSFTEQRIARSRAQ